MLNLDQFEFLDTIYIFTYKIIIYNEWQKKKKSDYKIKEIKYKKNTVIDLKRKYTFLKKRLFMPIYEQFL